MPKRTFFLLATLLAYTCFANAQQDEELVRVKFRTLPILSADWEGIFYQPAPEEEMVEIHFRSLSRSFLTYDYYGPRTLRFYREDGLDEEGEMRYRTVGLVNAAYKDLLIFFKPNSRQAETDPEFKLLPLDDSPNGLPINHISFINLTRASFACRFVEDNMVLPPGLTGPISIQDALGEDLFIGLAVSNAQTQRVVLKNRWEFQPGNRHLILLLPPKKAGSFRIRAYRITEFVGENQRFNPNWTPPEILEDSGL